MREVIESVFEQTCLVIGMCRRPSQFTAVNPVAQSLSLTLLRRITAQMHLNRCIASAAQPGRRQVYTAPRAGVLRQSLQQPDSHFRGTALQSPHGGIIQAKRRHRRKRQHVRVSRCAVQKTDFADGVAGSATDDVSGIGGIVSGDADLTFDDQEGITVVLPFESQCRALIELALRGKFGQRRQYVA